MVELLEHTMSEVVASAFPGYDNMSELEKGYFCRMNDVSDTCYVYHNPYRIEISSDYKLTITKFIGSDTTETVQDIINNMNSEPSMNKFYSTRKEMFFDIWYAMRNKEVNEEIRKEISNIIGE